MGVKFEGTACMTAFREHIIATLLLIQEEYLAEAKSHMLTPEGAESLKPEEITVLGNFIFANVSGGAWAAMDVFGRGSLMDDSNPALADYRVSEFWNPARYDKKIRSRPRGPYTNIFGETVNSNSNVAGIDIEAKGGKFSPQPPSHALQTAARWMANGRMQKIWQDAIRSFPWGNFIVVTPD